jgi:hypothetical protein
MVIAGANACPPEDCGGTWGFHELVQVLKNPKHSEYADKIEWLEEVMGLDYDPKYYSVDVVNRELGKLDEYIRHFEQYRR